jgi:predicted transposase/invertase (TIGR01784 family)
LYGSQIIRGNLYVDLKPVVLIVILNYKELDANRLHSVFHMSEDHNGEIFENDLEIHLIELPKLKSRKAIRGVRKDLLRWSRFFAAETDKDLENAVKGDKVMEKAKSYLEMLSQDPSTQEMARLREMGRVSYLLDINAARNEGRDEGYTRGKDDGKSEMLIEMVTHFFGELSEDQHKMLATLDPSVIVSRLRTAKSFDDLLDS